MKTLHDRLVALNACSVAVDWVGDKTLAEAWKTCDRPDWMLWFAGRICKTGSRLHRKVVLTACACARTALKYVPVGEERPRLAIEAAELWAKRPTKKNKDAASAAARAAARAASAAASAARAAAWSASDAANKNMADIIRRIIPVGKLK
jgi:hypothetical protein